MMLDVFMKSVADKDYIEFKASKRRSRGKVLTFLARTCNGLNMPTFRMIKNIPTFGRL